MLLHISCSIPFSKEKLCTLASGMKASTCQRKRQAQKNPRKSQKNTTDNLKPLLSSVQLIKQKHLKRFNSQAKKTKNMGKKRKVIQKEAFKIAELPSNFVFFCLVLYLTGTLTPDLPPSDKHYHIFWSILHLLLPQLQI